ncbi:hypothetical protein FS837_011849 [Tulasnella sp. UAMH 9824]|nr:hypothetical protein FS837_011849 [Tulasnella sp. UAMH 9824]
MQNLSSVRFEINRKLEVNLELLGHFLPPSVTDVDVCAIGGPEDGQRFLNALATEMKLPRLSSFSITVGSRPKKDVGASVSRVLRSHQGIERLTMDIGNSHQIHEVFRLAGQLPRLRHFEMCNYDGEALSLDQDSFPALESLKLASASHCLDSLLVRVPSEKITRLEMTVEDPLPASQDPSATPLADSFRTIGTFTHLRVLNVHLEVEATWETIHHILGCKELQTFVITALRGSSLELQESHLEQMGRAWPSLKTLRLQLHDSDAPETTYLKLSYLRVIATEFQNLRTLSIKFDARAASSSQFSLSDSTVPAQYSLQKLDVDLSLIDEEGLEVVGRLLASWWPNLLEITCRYYNLSATHWSAVQANYRSYISQDKM